ncbi:MAG: zeta toxin family protein [Bifidobacterium longum]|nr:zeta toxin family protein [Bifidobacterium longum]MDU4316891.1 zeta toxin family protein [Bifidobacterium longum]
MSEYAQLDADELAVIFDQFIAPSYHISPSEQPVLYMVGAQPGAGKTRAIARVAAAHTDACEVSGDDLRAYHPDYAAMMDDDALRMPDLTRDASGTWVRMSLDYLRLRKASVIVETTFAHPEANERTLDIFRKAGYRTVIIVVATPAPLSLLGILERYADQVERNGSGRWTDPEYHDQVVRQLPVSVQLLVQNGHADETDIIDRAGNPLFQARIGEANRDIVASQLADAVKAGLSPESLDDGQRQSAMESLHRIAGILQQTKSADVRISPLMERLQADFNA